MPRSKCVVGVGGRWYQKCREFTDCHHACEHTHIHTWGLFCMAALPQLEIKERHKYLRSVSACSIDNHKNTTTFSYDNMTHLAASTETAFLTPSHTEGPQSPFSLVQFKKLGEEDGANQVRMQIRLRQPLRPSSAQRCSGCYSL